MTKFRNREGIQAVNAENRTFEALQGSYVDNGVEVSTDGTDMTLDITSGTVVQSNTEHGIGATTVTVPDNNEAEPRKDIVYVDDAQSVSVATGASEIPDPELEKVESVFNTARPSPPSLVNQDDVVVLAEVWVEAGATEITSDELRDRRLSFGLETGDVDTQNLTDTESIDAPITNNNELTNLEGENISISNGDLNAESDNETFSVDEFFVVAEPELTEVLYTGDDFADSPASITNNLEGGDVVNKGFDDDEILNDFSLPESTVRGVAVDPKDGTLWYVTVDSADIINIERDGTEIQRVEDVLETSDTENIAIDPFDGTFWVVENNIFEVVNIDRDGNQIGSIDVSDVGDDSDPEGIVVDPLSDPEDKRFFYGEGRDDELHYIDEEANVLETFSVRERLEAIEVDPRDGSLWTVFDDNDNDDNELIHFTRTGEQIEVVYSASPGPKWSGVSIDPVDNTFWITRGSDDEIFRVPHKRGWLIEKDGKDYLLNRGVR